MCLKFVTESSKLYNTSRRTGETKEDELFFFFRGMQCHVSEKGSYSTCQHENIIQKVWHNGAAVSVPSQREVPKLIRVSHQIMSGWLPLKLSRPLSDAAAINDLDEKQSAF